MQLPVNGIKALLKVLMALALLIAAIDDSMAQDLDENNFTRYTKLQGLSHDVVTGMLQDSIGYVWISTYSGLNQFNGSTFIQCHNQNDSLSLPAEHIVGMSWLDSRRLAVYTDGLHIIDTRTGQIRNLFISYKDKQYEYKFNWIVTVSGNEAGDIFVLTRSGFYHFDKNYQPIFRYDAYTETEVSTTTFAFGRYLFWLDRQHLLIATTKGMFTYDIDKKLFKKSDAKDYPILGPFLHYPEEDYQYFQQKPGYFFIIKPGSDSLFYVDIPANKKTISRLPFASPEQEFDYRSEVGTISDTILYISGKLSGFYRMRLHPESGAIEFYPKKYFHSYYCRHLMEDHDHNLWIATNKGLFRQNGSHLYIHQSVIPESIQEQFPSIAIDDIYVLGNKIYVATRGNGGLLVFNKENLQFERRISFEKYRSTANNVYSIISPDNSTLWIATNGPLIKYDLKTAVTSQVLLPKWHQGTDWVGDLFMNKNKNIWIAADDIYKYDLPEKKYSVLNSDVGPIASLERANHILADSSGNIWISGHGLFRYNSESGNIDQKIDSFPYIKMPDKQVNSFAVDRENNLWINSNNNGLTFYNSTKHSVRHFTRDDGLPDNNIASIIAIGSKVWLATFSGIACIDIHSFRIINFGKEDGFPDMPIVNGAKFFYDAKENKLYIGFTNTLVVFDPNIVFQKSAVPRLFIESLGTGDQEKIIYPGKNITLSQGNDEITVTIGTINFFSGSSQRFAYRLVKDDTGYWQQLGSENSFSISNLSPGYHRIEVKLFSVNNRWPEQLTSFVVNLTPPFWKQTWFSAVSATLLLLAVYLLLKWRTGIIRKKERAKTNIQKLKADEYKNRFELEQISYYFSSSLEGKKNLDDVLWDVMKNLIGRMNYEDCIIYMWNKDKTKMIQKAAYGPKGNRKEMELQAFDVAPGQGLVGHVMISREPLLVPDTRKDPRYRVDEMNRLCELVVPIIHDGELIGIIDSEHPDEGHFKERDIQILTTIATLVGNKIKQIESEQSLEIKQKEIGFINQQLAEAQLSALQTQMNPHFIFNCLNSIKGMILENEQQKASRYLSKFANMIRMTLSQSKVIFTTLYENIEYLECYLAMEKLRFDDSFTYKITVDSSIDKEETLIPTLMIQPLTENAIWHGLMLKKEQKQLTIRFCRKEETISCVIEDNGIGIKQSEELKKLSRQGHQPVGLTNIRNRVKILNDKYDMGCVLKITDLSDLNKGETGTRVILRFNLIINQLKI